MRDMLRARRNRPKRNYRPFVEELRSRLAPAVLAGVDATVTTDDTLVEGEISYDDTATSYVVEDVDGEVSDVSVGQEDATLEEWALWSSVPLEGTEDGTVEFTTEETNEEFSIADDWVYLDDNVYFIDSAIDPWFSAENNLGEDVDPRILFNMVSRDVDVSLEISEDVYPANTDFSGLPDGGDLNGDGMVSVLLGPLPIDDSFAPESSPDLVDLGTDTFELSFTSGLAEASSASGDALNFGVPLVLVTKVETVKIEAVHGSVHSGVVHTDPVFVVSVHFEASFAIKIDVGNLPCPDDSETLESGLEG